MKTHSLHLVLAEDNPHEAAHSRRAIAGLPLGNEMVHLADGEAVLEFFLGQAGHARHSLFSRCLLLLDLSLPKVDGLTLINCLRGCPLTSSIPVVLLTDTLEDHLHAMSFGVAADDYLLKPLTNEKLHGLVVKLGLFWEVRGQRPKRVVRRSHARHPTPAVVSAAAMRPRINTA